MTPAQIFSPAQLLGYLALAIGITAFLQRRDQRLRLLNAIQCIVYAAHFFLLGNASASATALVSSARSFTAMRYRSRILAVVFVGLILLAGAHFITGPAGWLPIISSCASTVAMFLCRGIVLRAILFACTLLWLVNNVLSGSIGGTILETTIGLINLSTIVRMMLDRAKAAGIPALKPDCAGTATGG